MSVDGCAVHEVPVVDEGDFFDYADERGWTDGLPVVPPTESRVARMLEHAPGERGASLGRISPREGEATLERIAVNAVMAGCRPEYFPIVVAAVSCLVRPEMNTAAMQATTSPATPLVVVNGPLRGTVGLHAGRGCLGPGHRANATIGRALRLVLMNVGGGIPDQIDKSTHGIPAKFTLCLAENEESSPWSPLHVERGYDAGQSTVTVTSVLSVTNVRLPDPRPSSVANEIEILGDALAQRGLKSVQVGKGQPVVVLSPGTARIFAEAGYDKDRLRREVFDAARRPATYAAQPLTSYRIEDDRVLPYADPDDLVVVVSGGAEPNQALVLPTFVDSAVVTVPVDAPALASR